MQLTYRETQSIYRHLINYTPDELVELFTSHNYDVASWADIQVFGETLADMTIGTSEAARDWCESFDVSTEDVAAAITYTLEEAIYRSRH